MTLTVERANLADLGLRRFLRDHLRELAPTAPAESRHALELSGLQASHVRLWVVRGDGSIVGTGALAGVGPGHEELKSMRTKPERRGRGVASLLLQHLLADARARGVRRISLETGSMAFFEPARTLYTKAGFAPCRPFGDYLEDPNSVFMTLEL